MSFNKKQDIIFVHGAWHGAWCWSKYFVPFFEVAGYNCHTFDLPMHDSPGPKKGINFLRLKDYVNALKTEVKKVETPPIIIGHSMGGLILQKYLETETCEMAIFLASVPPSGTLATTLRLLKKRYTYPSILMLDLFRIVNTKEKAQWAFFSKDLLNEELEEYSNKLCAESFGVFLDMTFPMLKINKDCKIPKLVVAAENDNIFTIKENQQTAKKHQADFKLVKGIAHDVMLDTKRDQVALLMNEWIKMKTT